MTGPGRPRKRQRPVVRENVCETTRTSAWARAVEHLVERLESTKVLASALRNEESTRAIEITGRIAAKDAATKAVARVSAPPPSADVDIFSRGVRVEAERPRPDVPKVPPLPAMKLVMEQDPPEKLIHEQSVIVRAQAINRKNADLARERLPKQPEAQRNKTFHDYFLDEALWMAADFREERKWKIQMAKKVSKTVLQYHAQKAHREARSKAEAHLRLVKLAHSLARDVRKFWNQIAEIADYRRSLLEEAKNEKEKNSQLDLLLERTARYSNVIATSLQDPCIGDPPGREHLPKRVTFDASGTRNGFPSDSDEASDGDSSDSSVPTRGDQIESDHQDSYRDVTQTDYEEEEGSLESDDEITLAAAEAEEGRDEQEIENLEGEANMTVEELLKAQGIDVAAYKADKAQYLASDDEASEPSNEVNSDAESDDESTIRVAEAMEENDPAEVQKLESEHEMSVEDLLKSHGIDPSVYAADVKSYTRDDAHENNDRDGRTGHDTDKCSREGTTSLSDKPLSSSLELTSVASEATVSAARDDAMPFSVSRRIPSGPSVETVGLAPSFLLRGSLRDYQQRGMEWLVTLYKGNLNGILADEMGLGKTIQTIALLAWLATEKGVWGPHLIVVPTSVMVNWEVEFKKWLPGFKVLTYFGSVKERKLKRKGWTRPNTFHVCITSYNLALQDATALRRKKWVYLILDEAHNIKNFESQRWQTLLSFSSQRRLLITGTPLQNSVMELWSLMHFLMPHVFSSQQEFKYWFSKPLLETSEAHGEHRAERMKTVSKLHEVLRPFVLRRLKADVEKGLPPKHEHVIKCALSKRQRQLYEDFMARSDIRDTLQTGDFFSVMNILMQLRKVCNHPDLFEGRQILSPFSMQPVFYPVPAMATRALLASPEDSISVGLLGLDLCSLEQTWPGRWYADEGLKISAALQIRTELLRMGGDDLDVQKVQRLDSEDPKLAAQSRLLSFRRSQLRYLAQRSAMRLRQYALFGQDLISACTMTRRSLLESLRPDGVPCAFGPVGSSRLVRTMSDFANNAQPICERFVCCITRVTAPVVEYRFRGDDHLYAQLDRAFMKFEHATSSYQAMSRTSAIRSKVTIPDTRLIQWDCGKLQVLDTLLRRLQKSGSRALIFTQMTKVLDILEAFLNLHSLRYLRLDGTTKTDQRQKVVERFNTDDRIFCMILTTRAGGIGLNLTGADSVIFYDTDYNPAIDNQAQDRAHRIGQTKPVHIYRLVSEQTVEENILKRANQKRTLESLVISEAGFTTEAIRERDPGKGHDDSDGCTIAPLTSGSGQATGPEGPACNSLSTDPSHRPPITKGSAAVANGVVHQSDGTTQGPPAALAVDTAYGKFSGLAGGFDANGKNRSNDACHTSDILRYQDVTSKLLAAEDDREQIAVFTEQEEQRELRAEFEESVTCEDIVDKEDGTRCLHPQISAPDSRTLESSLNPVQRYALRLVESWRMSSGLKDAAKSTEADASFTVVKMLERRRNSIDVAKQGGGINVAAEFQAPETLAEDDGDPLVYEMDISAEGQESSLKALTDADADINLYLPLRDGGPEELKISSVVSGTAAAGLECAEDAAFFPHAYNRMSRTVYATHRQKEKAKANSRKRRMEKEARRKRELEEVAAVAAERERDKLATVQAARQQISVEKSKAVKAKADAQRGSGSLTHRKIRVDGGPKGRSAAGAGGSGVANDSQLLSSTGLFKRTTKKTTRRLSYSVGKSTAGGASSSMPGEGIGLNEGWTREEDQRVITAAAEFNNNMLLTADSLSLDPCVPAGLRRRRGPTHCLERLVTCLHKDTKSGPPSPKSCVSDCNVFKKHTDGLSAAWTAVRKARPPWTSLSSVAGNLHPSQVKVVTQAHSKSSGRFRSDLPPTYSSVAASIRFPSHFKPGMKPTETTVQALQRKRYPFLRPSREDSRSSPVRPGSSTRSSGPQSSNTASLLGTSGSVSKGAGVANVVGAAKPPKIHTQASTARVTAGGPRASANASSQMKVKPADTIVGAVADGKPRTPAAVATPKSSPSSTQGYFVPGTSARMNICQVGGSVPKAATVGPSTKAKTETVRSTAVDNAGHSSSALKSGKIARSAARAASAVNIVGGSGNGVNWNKGVKMGASTANSVPRGVVTARTTPRDEAPRLIPATKDKVVESSKGPENKADPPSTKAAPVTKPVKAAAAVTAAAPSVPQRAEGESEKDKV